MRAMYLFEIFDDFLPVDYQNQADRWIELLTAEATDKIVNTGGHSIERSAPSSEIPHYHYRFRLNNSSSTGLLPAVIIIPINKDTSGQQKDSRAMYVALLSETPLSQNDQALWREIILKAVDRLGEKDDAFAWYSVITQTPENLGVHISLKQQGKIGDLIIRSSGQRFIQYHTGRYPSMFGLNIDASYPIVIEGTSSGYNWFVASRKAGIETNRIAQVLSVAWNTALTLAHSAQLKTDNIKLPGSNVPVATDFPPFRPRRKYRQLPTWFEAALNMIKEDKVIRNSCAAYHQALMLQYKHPSYALIAFVGSIEAIGRKIIGDRCKCCSSRTSYNQRFRAGVDEVIKNKKEADRIYHLYVHRSTTAHDGELHGGEHHSGIVVLPSIFGNNSQGDILDSDIYLIRATAQKLLLKALKSQIKYA